MARLKQPPARLAGLPPRVGYATPIEAERARDRARAAADNLRGLYSTKRWRDLRQVILARDGWQCRQTGVLLVGEAPAPNSPVIDHIKPHRGDLALFWDADNLQAVAKSWHDSEKQRQERAADATGGWIKSPQPATR